MIVVTGPTGQIGSRILSELVKTQEKIRVIARDPENLRPDIRSHVEVIHGSHSEADIVNKAFEGADAVFWLVVTDFKAKVPETSYVDFSRAGCEAFKSHHVKRVVGVTALGRGWKKDAGPLTASMAMDDMIASTGVSYRAIACPTHMENLLRQAGTIHAHSVFTGPEPANVKSPIVSTRDIADMAARLLREESWGGFKEVPILGPEDLSNNDMAAIMSEVLQKPIRYQETPITDHYSMWIKRGLSERMAQAMVNMRIAKIEGIDRSVKRTSENSSPTTFGTWCEEVLKPSLSAR